MKLTAKTINHIRKSFYRSCINNGLNAFETSNIIRDMTNDSAKDVMAGIKSAKQRKLNQAAKKAWVTRRKNMV